MKEYKVPENLGYELLSGLHETGWVRCGGIPCSDCILQQDGQPDHLHCSLDREAALPTEIMERLVACEVITKVQALDLILGGKI